MKKIFLMVAIIATTLAQSVFAQNNQANNQSQNPELLPLYFSVKDALVSGNTDLASSKASELVNALNSPEGKTITGDSWNEILKHSEKISDSKDLKAQRQNFADLSLEMIVLAKKSKLSTELVYTMYCPMKKASWLSSSATIKNPYYGNSMLTCGKVVETLK